MKPQSTGLVELHDAHHKERGFNCMALIAFLTADGVTDWGRWHGAHLQAADGHCPYAEDCKIYARTSQKGIQTTFKFIE